MILGDLQSTVAAAILANVLFTEDAVVFEDLGNVKTKKEEALDVSTTPPGPGYNIAVWPPANGISNAEPYIAVGTQNRIIARFEVNPALFKTAAFLALDIDPSEWFMARLVAIMTSVLNIVPGPGEERFTLHSEAYELTDFDEGLIAYHIRFQKYAIPQ